MGIGIHGRGWTALDADGDEATLCAVSVKSSARSGERPQVVAAAELGNPGPQAQAASLHELMASMPRRVPLLVTLARSQYKLRVMPEPAVPVREMATSLRWTIASESEGLADEINLAWMPIPTETLLPARPRQVYAVTTASAWLAEQMAAWRQAGVRPKVVDIRETALRNLAGAIERPGEGLALVAADSAGVGIVFTHGGSLFLDRYIEQPLVRLKGADEATRARLFDRVAAQLLRSIDLVGRSYPFMPVSRVVVAPAPDVPGLTEFLAAQLPLAVEPLDLEQVFDLGPVPALVDSPALQARCLVPLGATLRNGRSGV